MSQFRAALAVSISLHLAVIFSGSLHNNTTVFRNISETKDFHLPVSVELIRSAEPTASAPPRSSSPALMKHPRDLIPQAARKASEQTAIKKLQLKDRAEYPLKPVTQEFRAITRTALESKKAWNRPPVYPDFSRRMGQEGRVILEASLDGNGKVIGVRVARSSGFVPLDQAAMDAVREWRMDLPANGSRRLFIPVTFELKSSS